MLSDKKTEINIPLIQNVNYYDYDCEESTADSDSDDSEYRLIDNEHTVEISQHSLNQTTSFSSILEIDDTSSGTFRISAVAFKSAPLMMTHYNHNPLTILLDTGAEFNIISSSIVKHLNVKILQTPSKASQVDKSLLKSVGKIVIPITNGEETWNFDALVCENVGDVIIGGNPLLDQGINPVTYRNEIDIVTSSGEIRKLPWRPQSCTTSSIPKIGILRPSDSVTLYPGDFLNIQAPPEFRTFGDAEVLVRPRSTSKVYSVTMTASTYKMDFFPPADYTWMIQGMIRLINNSSLPVIIPKHQHFADISLVTSGANLFPLIKPPHLSQCLNPLPPLPNQLHPNIHEMKRNQSMFKPSQELYPRPKPVPPVLQPEQVALDPDNILDQKTRNNFASINKKYSHVFSSKPGLYNGALGNLDAHLILNDNNVEPPSFPARKIVQSEKLDRIKQQLMDEMEADGLLVRPEDCGIHLTHVHDSYLVPKMDDGSPTGEFRLVTNLQSLSPYIKPTRIPLPTIDESFRKLGKWKFIILMDLRSWHWQIPMDKKSMRFLGTSTPFGGDRVYAVQPQGYLNATENSDRVIQAVLEPAVREGKCLRVADNLITGGNSPEEAMKNYELLLKLCDYCGLTFKAKKTVICPKQTNILGKVWNQGKLSPSTHLMSTIVSVSPPVTVKQMRSFTGSVKQMKDNLKNYHLLLHPLEKVVAGRKSAERITWTDSLREAFTKVQKFASNPDILALPKPSEKLIIFPDWSDEHQAGAAPLYVKRDSKLLKVRNFGQRLRAMKRWAPCEGEAWIIRTGVENHSPWIEESSVITEVATDNYPCVLAFKRLRRGLFSKSVRVAYFLSTLGSFRVELVHKPGLNHPGDYDSRNCASCSFGKNCQVCIFAFNLTGPTAQELAHPAEVTIPDAEVLGVTINDVLSGPAIIPYTQRPGWLDIQQENKVLKKLRLHMQGGTIPARKVQGQKELKSLYTLFLHQKITIAKDNMIVKVDVDKSGDKKETIVVPSNIMKGLIMALHYRFSHPHPSSKELLTLCNRYWFSVTTSKLIDEVKNNCQLCKSIAPVPREFFEQSTTKSGKLGASWACDVMRGDLQFVFIAREKLSSYTVTKIIPNERHETLREAIIVSTAELIPEDGLTIQVDNASGLVKLVGDSHLERLHIKVDTGRKNNKDSNPAAEKAVKEFREQKLRYKPEGGPISESERATITASLNRMIRNRNLSAREIVTNRNQNTHEPLNLCDDSLANEQLQLRLANHPLSEKSKIKGGSKALPTQVWPGALIFLKKDKSKLRARETYIVIKIEEEFCYIKKLKNRIMSENYKVKLSEICLLPCQQDPDDADDELESKEENDTNIQHRENVEPEPDLVENTTASEKVLEPGNRKYNLRRKEKVDYKKLNEGNVSKASKQKYDHNKFLYAWDTPESSDDDDEIPLEHLKLRFEIWCDAQPNFIPRQSIFLHYLKDKHPQADISRIQSLAKYILAKVKQSLTSESSSSPPDSPSSTGSSREQASLDWDNYASDPSYEASSLPRQDENSMLKENENRIVPEEEENENQFEYNENDDQSENDDDVFNIQSITPDDPTPSKGPRTLTDDPDLPLVLCKGNDVQLKRLQIRSSAPNLIQCPIANPLHSCPYPPITLPPSPHPPCNPPTPQPPPEPGSPGPPTVTPRRSSRLVQQRDYSSLNEYGKDGKDAWKGIN